MPPGRRKGAKKSTATAGSSRSRRQWNIGDLVLAKVKGFPAWPATVGEPGKLKWARPITTADRKKVFVHFFGTTQVAFCNPADIEEFTEKTKQYLAEQYLTKRQGRSEFVRAVTEIIEIYEERYNGVDETSSAGEDSNADEVNSPDLSVNSGFRDQVDTPWEINSQMKPSNSVTGKQELVYAAEDDLVVEPRGESYIIQKATADAVATATVKSLFPVKQERGSVQRSQSSSQIQNSVARRSDGAKNGGNNDGNIPADTISNKSIRRIKHIRKSPDLFGCNDTDSSAFASNVSMEGNGSDIVTINSDVCSLNEGSTICSNLKLEQSEIIECSEYVGLNKALGHEVKAVIGKKKRKPNRRRKINNAGAQNANQSLQNMSESPKERCSDQDGDEHLPLFKRRRVRMAINSSFTEEEHNQIAQVQEKSSKEVIIDSSLQIIASSNCENSCLADGDSSALNGVSVNVSRKLLAPCSENGSNASKVKKDQSFGSSVDDESSLPPSKRVQRALKAMYANAAEEATCIESSPSIMTSSGRSCISATKRCSCGNDCSDNRLCNLNPMILTEDNTSFEEDKTKSQLHESDKDVIPGAGHQSSEDLSDSGVCAFAKIDSKVLMHEKLSPNLDVKCCQVGSNEASLGLLVPPKADESIRPVIHSNASDTLDHRGINLDPVAGPNESAKLLCQKIINMPQNLTVVCEDMKGTAGDRSKINDTHVVVEEVKFERQQEDMISLSISNDCSGEKGGLGIPASSSMTDGGVCFPQGSPPNISVRHISTSDSSNIHQNGSCSPDVLQKNILSGPIDGRKDGAEANQQPRSMGKSTEAGDAALLYFEAMLATLTRTKETIGRATRIAIDCAKFGIATKVVESLVHGLENEPILSRRVDLFFLVDSIVQSSRGSKGDAGGVYPSAMQAFLPRLLSAAAPPGNPAQENRKQCLKVLRLWLERRILPEPIINHHIQELNSYSSSACASVYSQRLLRTDRALDDPIREMEGMLVDEYGSNSSFQLSAFHMPCKVEDGGSDSDGGNFQAVAPQHESEAYEVQEASHASEAYEVQEASHAFEKHRHVLEDVEGELEMEDVAPSLDVELNSICNVYGGNASQLDKKLPLSFAPHFSQDVPSFSPHPPSYAPPPPPPPPPPPSPPTMHLMSATSNQYRTAADSKAFSDSQTVHGKTFHSLAQPLAAPRNSQPMDATQFQIPKCRDVQMKIPESTCYSNSYPVRPPENSRSADGFAVHNKGYILRPPHRVPSDQFSFVHAENRLKSQREVPPPPSYSNRHHSVQNLKRENFYNNHERDGMRYNTRAPSEERWNTRAPHEERWNSRAPSEDRWNTRAPSEDRWNTRAPSEERWNTRAPSEDRWNTRAPSEERWNTRAPSEDRWNIRAPSEERWNTRAPSEERWNTRAPHEERWNTRAAYSGVLAPYGCHPSESTRSRGHGWRLPSSSMNYRYSMPFRQNFDDAIPAANRGPSFWRPRRTEITRL